MHLWWSHSSQEQSPENPGLAWVPELYSSMQIPRCVWCSTNFDLGLCVHCPSTGQLDPERNSIQMGRAPVIGNTTSEGCDMSFSHTPLPGLWIQTWGHLCSWHIHNCSWIYLVIEGDDGKRYLNQFGLISLTEVKSHYSHSKLELYGLFHTLHTVHVFIFGVANFTVDINAKYIKRMINNLDLQPNTTINCWITSILLFSFHLIHTPASHHTRADGLSHYSPSEDNPLQEDDFKDWLDRAYSFSIFLLNNHIPLSGGTADVSRYLTSTSHSYLHSLHTISILFSANPDSTPEDLELPHSPKVITKVVQINLIHDFL